MCTRPEDPGTCLEADVGARQRSRSASQGGWQHRLEVAQQVMASSSTAGCDLHDLQTDGGSTVELQSGLRAVCAGWP